MLANKWLCSSVLRVHVPQLAQALLELFAGRRILSYRSNQLHVVESGLLVQVIEQLNDLVKFVQVVDLNFALLELS